MLLIFTKAARPWRNVAMLGGLWMVLALLPYSFLTYMPRVPSRHTYLASAGQALLVAGGLLALRQNASRWNKAWLVPAAVGLIVAHQLGYLWMVKHDQYAQRAKPTEDLIRAAETAGRTVRAKCFPYSPVIAELALALRLGEASRPVFLVGPSAAQHPDAIDFCNDDADGVHY